MPSRAAGSEEPIVEVRRSRKRRRTVAAYREDDRVVVMIPARLSAKEEREWVATMLAAREVEAAASPATPVQPSATS
jgi:predicted metal-dependent hydrolase